MRGSEADYGNDGRSSRKITVFESAKNAKSIAKEVRGTERMPSKLF